MKKIITTVLLLSMSLSFSPLFAQANENEVKTKDELIKDVLELKKKQIELEQKLIEHKIEKYNKFTDLSEENNKEDEIRVSDSFSMGGLYFGYPFIDGSSYYEDAKGHMLTIGTLGYSITKKNLVLGGKININITPNPENNIYAGSGSIKFFAGARIKAGIIDIIPYAGMGIGAQAMFEIEEKKDKKNSKKNWWDSESTRDLNVNTSKWSLFYIPEAGLLLNVAATDKFGLGLNPYYAYPIDSSSGHFGLNFLIQFGNIR